MLVIVLIVFSALFFLISLILCLGARQYHKKRLVQIKPERIYSFSKRFLFLLNENIQFQKKHYPIRWITTKSNLKSRQNYPKVIHRITNLAVHDIFHHLNIIFSQIISSLTQPLIISKKCSFCFFSVPFKNDYFSFHLEFFLIYQKMANYSMIRLIFIFIFHRKVRMFQ